MGIQTTIDQPSGPDSLAAGSGPEGTPTVEQESTGAPTQLSAVSDMVALTDEVAKSYEGFNPTLHAMKDGKPVLTKGGAYAMKRGRKGGAGTPVANTSPDMAKTGAPSDGPKMSDDQAAEVLLHTAVTACIAIFGDEWDVSEEKEFKTLKAGVKAYVTSVGGLDVSPGWGLLFVSARYAGPRLQMPETKSRLKTFTNWVRGFFGK